MTNHPNRSKYATYHGGQGPKDWPQPKFQEGQEVEAWIAAEGAWRWRKAKILTVSRPDEPPQTVSVIFTDGTSGVFDVEHIRISAPAATTQTDLQTADKSDIADYVRRLQNK